MAGVSGEGIDPYQDVVDLVAQVADAPAHAASRLEAMVEQLIELSGSITGLMVQGAPDGYDVHAIGRGASSTARSRISDEMRITAGPDPLIDPIRDGDLRPTTAARAYGGQEIWAASPKCIGSLEIWGIDQAAALPVRGGEEFVAFLIGRRGSDYTCEDLERLRTVQPAIVGLIGILEPLHLDAPSLRIAQLTAREQEVLRLLADGHKAAAIGHRAGCSQRTVHRHLSNIYDKLDVGDRLSAVVRAQQLGLLEHDRAVPRHG